MSLRKPTKFALACALLAAIVVVPVAALAVGGRRDEAVIRVDGLVLRANGGVRPTVLPPRRYAPISLHGYANVKGRRGGPPPPLESLVLDFTRNSRIHTRGLPVCPPERLRGKTARGARRACPGALVATGNVEALVDLPDTPVFPVRTPVAAFNGPPQDGRPTLVFHSRVSLSVESSAIPSTQTYVLQEPLLPSPRGGLRLDIDIPEIAGGYASFSHGNLKIGKRVYRFRGGRRSFISARCPTGVLFVWGRLGFADGTVISGTLYTPCTARRRR